MKNMALNTFHMTLIKFQRTLLVLLRLVNFTSHLSKKDEVENQFTNFINIEFNHSRGENVVAITLKLFHGFFLSTLFKLNFR